MKHLMKSTLRRLGTAAAVSLALAGLAQAATITLPDSVLSNSLGAYTANGYYTNDLGSVAVMTGGGNASNVGLASGRNDDGFSAYNLGFSFTFFNTTYNSLFLNNNGNVSFGAGISAFVPSGPTGSASPVISPFFGDVDTRAAASGVMSVNAATANQIVVTWNQVGRFSARGDLLNSFQLVLRGDGFAVPNGEGQIGFFYGAMPWLTTDTSLTAAVGFGDGAGNAEVLASSLANNINAIVQNKYVWFDAQRTPVTPVPPTTPTTPPTPPASDVPEPASYALALLALAGVAVTRRRR